MTSLCYNSPIGPLLVAEEDGHIVEISFMDRDTRPEFRKAVQLLDIPCGAVQPLEIPSGAARPQNQPQPGDTVVAATCIEELKAYFAGKLREFTVPFKPKGTDFRKRVWTALMTIPYGQTISYKELAVRIGQPNASRAVGGANNHNPISIIVPCHRVIGANGALVGYGGGLDIKEFLLKHELAILQQTQ